MSAHPDENVVKTAGVDANEDIRRSATLSKDQRYYVFDSPAIPAPLPRVSTILAMIHSQGLDDWRREKGFEEADRIGEEAANYGNALHAACEAINYGVPIVKAEYGIGYSEHEGCYTNPERARDAIKEGKKATFVVRPDCWDSANRWGEYKEAHVEQVIYAEHLVWSAQYGFAGSLDNCLLLKDGRVALGDFKSSNWLKWPYRLQLAAYQVALWQTERVKADVRLMFDMPKKKPGKLFVVPYNDDEYDWAGFRAANFLFRMDREYADDYRSAWGHEWKPEGA